jgi:hypothetical protein
MALTEQEVTKMRAACDYEARYGSEAAFDIYTVAQLCDFWLDCLAKLRGGEGSEDA